MPPVLETESQVQEVQHFYQGHSQCPNSIILELAIYYSMLCLKEWPWVNELQSSETATMKNCKVLTLYTLLYCGQIFQLLKTGLGQGTPAFSVIWREAEKKVWSDKLHEWCREGLQDSGGRHSRHSFCPGNVLMKGLTCFPIEVKSLCRVRQEEIGREYPENWTQQRTPRWSTWRDVVGELKDTSGFL